MSTKRAHVDALRPNVHAAAPAFSAAAVNAAAAAEHALRAEGLLHLPAEVLHFSVKGAPVHFCSMSVGLGVVAVVGSTALMRG